MSEPRERDICWLCDQALARAEPERAAFLDKACGGDAALRREVESLLAGEAQAHAFLETPAFVTAAPLAAGARLGVYEIVSRLGAGGMGEVYRARDTRLDRLVAIKVLPPAFATDPARRARFEREAKAIAALSHPNICPLFDVGHENGVDFLVMEHLDGQTLAARLEKGKLPLDQALAIGAQIADALAAAHRQGIIHRDLKPTNVMLTKGGGSGRAAPEVKLLDFGLAKLKGHGDQPAASQLTAGRPTSLTAEGTIVGTLQYMAPEQVEGKTADARIDLWALGAILYEMVTGQRAFAGTSAASLVAAILEHEPAPLSTLQPSAPPALDHLITRCLAKDPDARWDSAHAAAEDLRWMRGMSGAAATARVDRSRRRWRWWVPAGVAAIVILAALWAWLWPPAAPADLVATTLTSYLGIETQPSFSPDGTKLAFVWDGEKEDNPDLYIKQIGSAAPPMRLTTNAAAEASPAWSPDDRWIAFTREQRDQGTIAILLIPPLGGPERTLAEMGSVAGLCWTPDGKWLAFSGGDPGRVSLSAVQVDTGEQRRLTSFLPPLPARQDNPMGDLHPSISPDGSALAFARRGNWVAAAYVLSLTHDLRPAGEPIRLTDQHYASITGFAWTADGRDIVYAAGGTLSRSLWRVSVSGRRRPERLPYAMPDATFPAIAPKTSRLAFTWHIYNANLWRLDTRTKETRKLIGSTYSSLNAQYSRDGRKIAFQSNRTGHTEVWTCDADGSNCMQLTSFGGPMCGTPRWSPDGRWIALDSRAEGRSEIYVIAAGGGTPRRVTNGPSDNYIPTWSADGRWLYFTSDRSGRREIWKIPVGGGQAVQVTRAGGSAALSSPDGTFIYYLKGPGLGGLFRMPAAGGDETLVLPHVSDWTWGVTEAGVYFGVGAAIQFLDTATGAVSTIAVVDNIEDGLCVSADGHYVVWEQLDRNTIDLMLVENFR